MTLPAFIAAARRFDPRTLPGLEAWWDAADAATVTLDSGRVSEWRDKSGLGRHAANATSGSTQPDYALAARNGLNVLRFTAANSQCVTVPNSTGTFNFLHNGAPSWMAAVSVYGTSSNPLANLSLFGNNGQTSANIGVSFSYDDRNIPGTFVTSDALAMQVTTISNGANPIRLLTANSQAILPAYSNIVTPQTMLVQEAVIAPSAAPPAARFRLRLNGGSEIAANTGVGVPTTSNAAFNFQIGGNGNNVNTMEGDICELLLFSQVPPRLARDAIRAYLAKKWGVTLA